MRVIEELEKKLAQAVPLGLYRSLIRRPAIGLTYHAVSNQPLPHLKHIYPTKTPAAFEADLKYLRANADLVSYDQLKDHYHGKIRLKSNSILITFDDGYVECASVVRPLLLKYGVPCVFFLTTELIDNRTMFYRNKYSLCVDGIHQLSEARLAPLIEGINQDHDQSLPDRAALTRWLRSIKHPNEGVIDDICDRLGIDIRMALATAKPYLTSEQIKRLAADGFTIGAHGRQHVKFNTLDESQIEADLLGACEAIRTWTGQHSVPFSFPFSGYGVDRRFLAALRQRHPFLGLFFESTGFRKEPPFIINRVWADPPPTPGSQASNLEQLLHTAYQRHLLWRRQYYLSVLLARIGVHGQRSPDENAP